MRNPLRNPLSFRSSSCLGFANTRTLSPPWVHVVRTLVPLSCCEEAATYLVKALGGEDVARQNVGGIKWWQVRGVQGFVPLLYLDSIDHSSYTHFYDSIQAQWITEKKDWQEAKRRHKMQKDQASNDPSPPVINVKEGSNSSSDSGAYDKDMDAMRCILYLHGGRALPCHAVALQSDLIVVILTGGYYFGSVDQSRYAKLHITRKEPCLSRPSSRYSIQRHARKINGRVFGMFLNDIFGGPN